MRNTREQTNAMLTIHVIMKERSKLLERHVRTLVWEKLALQEVGDNGSSCQVGGAPPPLLDSFHSLSSARSEKLLAGTGTGIGAGLSAGRNQKGRCQRLEPVTFLVAPLGSQSVRT